MELKTMKIKDKDYVTVAERVRAFRELHPDWSILTDILSNDAGICLMQATIKDTEGRILATGHAYEKEGSSFINAGSYIENAETSAVGRALGILGIGITNSIAGAEEIQNAVANQNTTTTHTVSLDEALDRHIEIVEQHESHAA